MKVIKIFPISNVNSNKIYFIAFFILTFYKAFIKFRNIFNSFRGNFWDIAHPYELFSSQ